MKRIFLVFLAFSFVTASFAQQKKIIADKILGIVGDRIILYSDIQNSIADIARQGGTVPDNAQCSIMEQALVSKVLMLQAEKDSLIVTPEEVEAELDQRVRYFISQYGTQEAVEQLAGKTIYQIKDDARESVKERKLAEAMQKKIVDNIRITPAEVKAYFERVPKDSLPFFETEVEVGQIIVYPKASRDLEKYAQDELANYKKQIDAKLITFEQAVKRFSDEPGAKERGGLINMNRNEKNYDPAFMAASFRLKEGEISQITKTKFGYHLIMMLQRNGDDVVVRHLIKVPPVTEEEMTAGASKLDSVRAKLIAGTIDFNTAAGKYSEDDQAKFIGPLIMSSDGDTYNRIDELDKDVVAMLGKLKIGEFSQPMQFTDERAQKKGVRILYLKSRSEPHIMNLRDDYNKISQAAQDEKKFLALDKWMNLHIPTYYIMIDPDAGNCKQLQKWTGVAKAIAAF